MNDTVDLLQQAAQFRADFARITQAISRIFIGQPNIVQDLLTAFFAGGHVLLEGVPGLGKTLLAQIFSKGLSLRYSRIQFTPDLMPADILGTNILLKGDDATPVIRYEKGPIFANLVLADEINRATPRTQSALLQAMQETRVTVAGKTYMLPQPFMVIATQNPIEMEGTYPLPEAQLDRFFYKLVVAFPAQQDLVAIANSTTGATIPDIECQIDLTTIAQSKLVVSQICIADYLTEYAARLVLATQPFSDNALPLVKKYVQYGVSPRGLQALIMGAKVRALAAGRVHVAESDIIRGMVPALQHRIILNFEGEADGITTRQIIENLQKNVGGQNL